MPHLKNNNIHDSNPHNGALTLMGAIHFMSKEFNGHERNALSNVPLRNPREDSLSSQTYKIHKDHSPVPSYADFRARPEIISQFNYYKILSNFKNSRSPDIRHP